MARFCSATILAFLLAFTPASFGAEASDGNGQPTVSFELDVQPILTAHGCNAGACHGKQRGQNGFQLSLLGFDSDFDYAALALNARGRRVSAASPERSLLLRKVIGEVPHGGGIRIAPGSDDYNTLLRWVVEGLPRRVENEPRLSRVEVSPSELVMKPKEQRTLQVTAFYSDGTQRDVTLRSTFQSNLSALAAVDRQGQVTSGPLPGETAIMARYMGEIAIAQVLIPLANQPPPEVYAALPRNNFIDDLVWKKLQTLGVLPSESVSDATYMRRVYIDIIGRLPDAEECREFLSDSREDRRALLVDRLLQRPEYADHWANKWADLLRPNPYRVGIKAVLNYDNWIRDQFRRNRPYDEMVTDLVTARGSTWHNGAATLFRDRREPDELTTMVSQLFLGVRLECAKCHHHPFEKWGQDHFYSFAAYFARVGHKGTGLSPPISGGEEIITVAKSGTVSHPLTGEAMAPRPLFGDAPELGPDQDPREALADWMKSPENVFFAQVQVNRVWADLMGLGLVDPVDDLRMTNPATNPELLAALGEHFREAKFDQKELIRTIVGSHVYQLSSIPNETNVGDRLNFSRHYRQRLRAEVLLGAFDDITGVRTSFSAMPVGSRPNQIWTHRVESRFLDTFGRPDPNQDPPCERVPDSTVTQTLHLMNAPALQEKVVSDKGRAAELAASDLAPDEIVEELYLRIYSRNPTEEEREIGAKLLAPVEGEEDKARRRRNTEDLMWALLNTPEFLFKD
ncbi:MAG: DUF1549 domain-containing protein [Planctomycetales bacterium]|nr:DUF1549 domain-containing protein [Planctomycetales bacterium]